VSEAVLLPADLDRAMRRLAAAAAPREACGLLVGRGTAVAALAPSANLAGADDAFELDTALRLALQRRLRGSARQVTGVWHSHPRTRAEPSARDAAGAWEPALLWLITGTDGTRAWRPEADGFRELPVRRA
jgi:proteasome lid subunit RPN8/RPN11